MAGNTASYGTTTMENRTGEIEETTAASIDADESSPLLPTKPKSRTVTTKVPEIEVHLYRLGQGPIDVFKSSLDGWEQDQLEVQNILDKYGFKSIYAYNTTSGRGVPIRFNPRNGRSLLPYMDGSVIYIDGEPKDSMLKPVTKILLGVTIITLLIVLVTRETPNWAKKWNVFDGRFNIPPWILACIVIVFTRMRKRARDFFKRRGW